MKQAVMITPGKIIFNDVNKPQVKNDEVLIKIYRIGICGSDVHVWHGKHPYTSYPVIQGHEYAGIIEAVGRNVQNLKIGTKVTATPQVVCGICNPCKRGDYNICEKLKVQGFQAPGVAQDYFVTTADKIVVLPDDFLFEEGAFVEPVAVAVHAVNRIKKVTNRLIIVFGAGPIGNLIAQVLQAYGATVLITDLSNYRLEVAKECGIQNVTNSTTESVEEAIERVFGSNSFGLAFECVGIEKTMENGIKNIEKGGKIVVVGVFSEKPRIDLGLVQDKELSLIGTLMYKHDDYLEAVKLIHSKKIIIKPLFSKHFDFYQFNEAYSFIDKERENVMKVFIDVN